MTEDDKPEAAVERVIGPVTGSRHRRAVSAAGRPCSPADKSVARAGRPPRRGPEPEDGWRAFDEQGRRLPRKEVEPTTPAGRSPRLSTSGGGGSRGGSGQA